MTLTIKDPLELTSPAQAGSPSQSSENKSGESPRTNPVCLEAPVTVRSLPGENGDASESSGPIREEGKTVIVFDNGAVLRLSNTLPSGQKVILSNSQGNEIVCRIVKGRNLPTAKGYVEVEFIEQFNDFWRIHQPAEPVNVLPPPVPVLTSQSPLPVVPPLAPPVKPPLASRPARPVNETASPSGSAPTFEDVAGVVRMSSSSATAPINPGAPAAQMGGLKSKNDVRNDPSEPAKSPSTLSAPSPNSDATSGKRSIPAAQKLPSLPAQKPSPSNDFMARGMLASGQISSVSSRGEGRRRMPLIIGGAVLVLAGFGAGYFFMHQGSAPSSPAQAAVAAQPSPPLPPAQSNQANPDQMSQPGVDQAQSQSQPQPVSEISATPSEAEVSSPSDAQSSHRTADTMGTKPPDRASERRQQIPNLRMKSPSAPKQNLAKFSGGTTPNVTDVSSAVAVGGAPAAAMLSSVVRSENQPAPPPSLVSSAPSNGAVREPKLVTFARPTYPSLARQSNTQGIVVVSAAVDVKGNVTDAKAIRGPVSLRQAAIDAVTKWKYAPELIDGKPAAARVTVNVEFRLN